jgi:predicted acylesterase/phospholipase RssA
MSALNRKSFLAGGFGGALAATLSSTPAATAQPLAPTGGTALVLTGGVNRGAYQAGVVAGLVEQLGLRDGEPLPFDVVTGTSIGALNGYFVASAQYSRMREVWLEIPRRHVFRLKAKYANITRESSGVGTRLYEAIALALGMIKSDRGIFDQNVLMQLLREFVGLSVPMHAPLYFTSTNLTRRRAELFCRPGTSELGRRRQERVDRILASRRLIRPPRLVGDAILHDALLSSACLPVAFEPIQIPREDGSGKIDEYVDGGIVSNAAIGIAQRTSTLVRVIAVEPPRRTEPDEHYASALDVAVGVFGIMQQTITNYATLYAFAESVLISDDPSAAKNAGFADESLPLRIEYVAPRQALPGDPADFEDGDAIAQMLEIGRKDALRGWTAFSLSSVIS